MGKPQRPEAISGVTRAILNDMEQGDIEYTEAIDLIQRLRFSEPETFQAIIYAYDYGRWNRSQPRMRVMS